MTHLEEVKKYCKDIKTGKIPASIWVKKAVNRFLNDLKLCQTESDYKYIFDEESFNEIVDFAQSLFIPDLQATLTLLPYHKFIYCNLFGFKLRANPKEKRFKTAYILMARKQSKTFSIMFPILLYDLITTPSAEAFFVSTTGDLALESFEKLTQIIKSTPELSQLECFHNAITFGFSKIGFYGSEDTNFDSTRPSTALLDEMFSYPTIKPFSGLSKGGRARKNGSQTICITTAGTDTNCPCYELEKHCKDVLSGVFDEPEWFGIIYNYETENGLADWKDPNNFILSNPALNVIVKEETLKQDLNLALSSPMLQPDFKAKTCNIWCDAKSDYIPIERFLKNYETKIDFEKLKTIPCYCGLDLSKCDDLTAFTMCWELDNFYYFKHFTFIPEEKLFEKYKHSSTKFLDWVEQGLVITIPGPTIDYSYVFQVIKEQAQQFNIVEIAYDRLFSTPLINQIQEELPNIITVDYNQSPTNFSTPTETYKKAVFDGKVIDNNPLIVWELGNITVKANPNGLVKVYKPSHSSTQKIDHIICSIMALDRCIANKNTQPEMTLEEILSCF